MCGNSGSNLSKQILQMLECLHGKNITLDLYRLQAAHLRLYGISKISCSP